MYDLSLLSYPTSLSFWLFKEAGRRWKGKRKTNRLPFLGPTTKLLQITSLKAELPFTWSSLCVEEFDFVFLAFLWSWCSCSLSLSLMLIHPSLLHRFSSFSTLMTWRTWLGGKPVWLRVVSWNGIPRQVGWDAGDVQRVESSNYSQRHGEARIELGIMMGFGIEFMGLRLCLLPSRAMGVRKAYFLGFLFMHYVQTRWLGLGN